jgi:hypothetical protein
MAVSVDVRITEAPDFWPPAAELERLGSGGALVLLPDAIEHVKGKTRAAYREEAQALRVAAERDGTTVVFAAPETAVPVVRREHDSTLVLAAAFSLPAQIAATLVANELQRQIDRWRGGEEEQAASEPPPLPVRVREVFIDDRVMVRELEGPAEEVAKLLTKQLQAGAGPASHRAAEDPTGSDVSRG